MDDSLKESVSCNRAGENEKHLSYKKVLEKFFAPDPYADRRQYNYHVAYEPDWNPLEPKEGILTVNIVGNRWRALISDDNGCKWSELQEIEQSSHKDLLRWLEERDKIKFEELQDE